MRDTSHVPTDQSFPPSPPCETPERLPVTYEVLIRQSFAEGTLASKLVQVAGERWYGRRGLRVSICQAVHAIETLAAIGGWHPSTVPVEGATTSLIQAAVLKWKGEGLSPVTINKRVGALGMMGAPVVWRDAKTLVRRSCFVPPRKPLKWWLRPEDEARLATWVGTERPDLLPLLLHVLWTTRTGLRVEETLRLQRRHFVDLDGESPAFTVPGTKTAGAGDVTLPLSRDAAAIARLCFTRWPGEDRMVPLSYEALRGQWQDAREFLGAAAEPLATLKALRRSAARYLHVGKGMPLDMVRTYLRHSNVTTTMGYLRLTGGYAHADLRRFL